MPPVSLSRSHSLIQAGKGSYREGKNERRIAMRALTTDKEGGRVEGKLTHRDPCQVRVSTPHAIESTNSWALSSHTPSESIGITLVHQMFAHPPDEGQLRERLEDKLDHLPPSRRERAREPRAKGVKPPGMKQASIEGGRSFRSCTNSRQNIVCPRGTGGKESNQAKRVHGRREWARETAASQQVRYGTVR